MLALAATMMLLMLLATASLDSPGLGSPGFESPAPSGPPRVATRELVRRIPESDEWLWATKPDAARWHTHPAVEELRVRIERGEELDFEDWRTLLIDKHYLRWRTKWPVGKPFAIALHVPALGNGIGVRLETANPEWKPAEAVFRSVMCATVRDDSHVREAYQELGMLRPGRKSVRFELFAVRRTWAGETPTEIRHRVGALELDIEPVATFHEALMPVDDDELGPSLAPLLRIAVAKQRRSKLPSLNVKWASWPRELSIVLDVELWHRDKVVATHRLRPGAPLDGDLCRIPELPVEVALGKRSAFGWSLRLCGTSDEALRNWDATHYWADAIEIDLADLVTRGSDPKSKR